MSTQTLGQHRPGQDEFLFLGNQLALDFLNTRPVQNGAPVELLPDVDALLRWFRAAGLLSSRQIAVLQREWGNSSRARRTLAVMWELREKLRKELLAWEGGSQVQRATIDELNRLMAEHPMLSRLTLKGSAPMVQQWFAARQPEDLLAPLAHRAAALFAEVDRKRVRKCGQCVLHFHDTSKKGTRRWCSMQVCGNRLKVASYVARQRGQAAGKRV